MDCIMEVWGGKRKTWLDFAGYVTLAEVCALKMSLDYDGMWKFGGKGVSLNEHRASIYRKPINLAFLTQSLNQMNTVPPMVQCSNLTSET